VGLQMLENKALSWGSIGKSAPILAEITIRKSQSPTFRPAKAGCISLSSWIWARVPWSGGPWLTTGGQSW
jgi:hypothetical protein